MASRVPELTATPRAQEIISSARGLLEEEGYDGLTMRRLAERLGIRAPSLYKHLPDKQALETALIRIGFEEWMDAFEQAATSEAPLPALLAAYRAFARDYLHLYRLMTERPLDRERLGPGIEERAAAPFATATGGDPDLARALWAFAHGMTILELNERFPNNADIDAAWTRGAHALVQP